MTSDLLEQIGGMRFIRSLVPEMYTRILSDTMLQPFFQGIDDIALKHKMSSFLGIAFGDPEHQRRVDLHAAHYKLRPLGLNDQHFDRFLHHLQAVLQAHELEAVMIQQVLAHLQPYRAQVLG